MTKVAMTALCMGCGIRGSGSRDRSSHLEACPIRREEGFSLVELLIVVSIFFIIFAIAIPHYLTSRSNAQAAGAKADMKTIHSSELAYFAGAGQGRYGTFPQLEALNLLPSGFCNSDTTYVRFNYTGTITFGTNNMTFSISAVPPVISRNTPSFYIDDTGSVRFSESSTAGSTSTPAGQQ